jgi:hypothetical protein
MKKLTATKGVIVLALAVAAETAALACSCAAPGTAAESRVAAREAVRGAVAIVQVEVLAGYDQQRRRGEQLRVKRTLFGRAPATVELYRPSAPSSAGCDLELGRSQRRVLILYPAPGGFFSGRRYRTQSLCSDYLTSPFYLPITLQEARRRR